MQLQFSIAQQTNPTAEASDSAFASVLNGSVTDEVGDEIRDEVAKDQLKNVQLTCAVVAFHSF